MSSELCRETQPGETGQRRRREKKQEEAEVPCRNHHRPAGSLRQEEPGTGQPLSPDRDDMQEMTSEGRSEQVQREEAVTLNRRMGLSQLAVKHKRQRRGTESGLCIVKCDLHKSKPRGSLTFSHMDKDKDRQVEEPPGSRPLFFFGGTNGAQIVSSYCESKGWRRIYNKDREDFRLKWCETKSSTIYSHFREGKQLLYQIPNNNVLTSKIGLLSSLREYERVSSKVKLSQGHRRLKMEEFIPTTFRMDVRKERDIFFALFTQQEGERESSMWICKPTGQNQGKGIFLLKSLEDVEAFRLKLQHLEDNQANRSLHHLQNQPYIVQRYIQNPLLLKRRKFDVRSYLLIACTAPYMVFFRHGYVRLTCDIYDPKSKNLSTHLTNQYMQKKNPLYSLLKEDTVWSMESFNTYVNDRLQVARGLPRDWVLGAFAKRMQQIMTQCFFAVKSKLDQRLGFFDLIGCDFMVDEDFKICLWRSSTSVASGRESFLWSVRETLCCCMTAF
ncbi:protein polyglycylase TTLL10 isoform X2 [Kryptolebias marmoratus]|uniref:protein polyglycylase TTLL10 isoform X2 n=1 Tax=Kryptolebias marmoratus TaxID=37003 RepID=UPI0018ACF25F|nr:protein polyglycylase TTLL10 isoform X2 [Kryptolebias marmoratus]